MESTQNGAEKITGSKRQNAQEIAEELAFLRQKITSLSFRGDYAACIKMIDENMRKLYEHERWPDIFFSILRTYQRCYTALRKPEPFEEYIIAKLKKNNVPVIFANLLRGSDSSIVWSVNYFKDLAVFSENLGDYETALSYIDLVMKLDPANSGACVIRGWILDDLERPEEALKMYKLALELNEANHSARNSLAKHFADKMPAEALEHINKAIEAAPTEGSYYDTKAKILLRTGERDAAVSCYDLAMSASPYVADYPYKKAELLLADNKEMAAITHYRKTLALDENHIPSLWRLARLYKDSQPEIALVYANTLALLEPENQEALLLKGMLLGTLGEETEAAIQFKSLIELAPDSPEVLGEFASLLVHSDPVTAIEYYERAIALAPKNADFHMGKGRAHENLGQIPQAVKEYRAAIATDKKNARAYGRLGTLLADTKPREAISCYTKAIELMPDNSFYYAAKAELLMKNPGNKNEAISCFSQASKHDPNNASLHMYLARLLEETGNTASALENYKQAVAIDATDAEAFYAIARLVLQSAPESALLHINSALSLDALNGEYYYFKSRVLSALGHNKQAIEQCAESLRADGRNPEALIELSQLMGEDSPRVALMYINRAIEISPDNQEYICARANLLFNMGQPKKALGQYEAVFKRDAKNHEAVFGVGRCLAAENDAKAVEYFNKAIALDSGVAVYHAEKAAFLAANNRVDEALAAYDAAIALDAKNWECNLAKAKLLDAAGKIPEACEHYKHTLLTFPDCPEAVGRLGILLADENPGAALDYLNHAIDILPEEYIYHAWRGRVLLALGHKDAATADYLEAARLGGETAETYYALAEILFESMPETALGYCLRAINENPAVAGYHLLCGKLYILSGYPLQALEQFRLALDTNPKCHEAYEKIADIQYEHRDPDVLDAVNLALDNLPGCAHCLMLKAIILDEQAEEDNSEETIACLDLALKTSPELIPARQKLIELLGKKRMFVRLALEKRKLAKYSH